MSYVQSDGTRLYVEETGSGYPVIFVHEFAGDHRSWEDQVRRLSRVYRCVTFNARGFPPSDVPETASAYGYIRAVDDIAAVLGHLKISRAHVVGLSMGGYAALLFGLRYRSMASALVVAGCGAGSEPSVHETYVRDIPTRADRLAREGVTRKVEDAIAAVNRGQLRQKDGIAWTRFVQHLGQHSAIGSALTLRHVQGTRPALHEFEAELRALEIPLLIVTGDEDEQCLQPSLYLKRTVPGSGLWVVPWSGHAVNLEEPDTFNDALMSFFGAVERGAWQRFARTTPFVDSRI